MAKDRAKAAGKKPKQRIRAYVQNDGSVQAGVVMPAVVAEQQPADIANLLQRPIIRQETILKSRRSVLASMSYQDYLQSPEWSVIRRWMRSLQPTCQTCGAEKSLHVHHRNYPERGKECAGDLIVLCERCHRAFHGLDDAPNVPPAMLAFFNDRDDDATRLLATRLYGYVDDIGSLLQLNMAFAREHKVQNGLFNGVVVLGAMAEIGGDFIRAYRETLPDSGSGREARRKAEAVQN